MTGEEDFRLVPSTPIIGAEVVGLDLCVELDPACREQLRRALAERGVLFLPGQHISPADHLRFASIFGESREVSAFFPQLSGNRYVEVLEGHGESIGTDVWHTDLSWQRNPAVVTCLHARDLPPVGGDTVWASMTAAHDMVSPDLRATIAHLHAEHTWEKSITAYVRGGPDGDERYRRHRAEHPPVRHRVVQRHPVTGRSVLYVNDLFTTAIHGLPRHEAEALLALLTGMARIPELQVRYRWQPDAVVVWDNRAVQHYAVTDYRPHHRKLHRITVDDPATSFTAVDEG